MPWRVVFSPQGVDYTEWVDPPSPRDVTYDTVSEALDAILLVAEADRMLSNLPNLPQSGE